MHDDRKRTHAWRRLRHNGGVDLALMLAAIAASYVWLDRPIAYFVHDHGWQRWAWLDTLTQLPILLVIASSVLLLAAPLLLAEKRQPGSCLRILLAMASSLAIASFLKEQLKILFGRAWPLTWTHGNPSLIHDHVYGFFWLRADNAFHSFPSGHTTLTFAVVSVLGQALPAWRWLGIAAGGAIGIGLLGMDYHFLSDVLAGALLGSLCGRTVWAQMRPPPRA